ncbi:MAG: hypothetical protein LBB09_01635 [Rickettsiales bacterium]|jgi:hypothetical protein|nr:hypothetical protein [Rickettsiales bacterium]
MKNKYFKIFLLAFSFVLFLSGKGYASSIPGRFSVNMPIPSWYRRDSELIRQTNGAINVLLAYFGTQEELPRRTRAEKGIRSVLTDEEDWPSGIVAFREREEVINEEYKNALKAKKDIPLHQANKKDFINIKKQFGIE